MNSITIGRGSDTITLIATTSGTVIISGPRTLTALDHERAAQLHDALGRLLDTEPNP